MPTQEQGDTNTPLEREEERVLVAGMLAGAESSFEEFADHYIPALFRFSMRLLNGQEELARDLSQQAVCKALQNLRSFKHQSSLFTWLCSCCKNEIRMHFRTESRRPKQVDFDAPEVSISPRLRADAEQELEVLQAEERRSTADRVHRLLDSLPPRYANVLSWKYVEKQPTSVIAERLGITPKAAESLLGRARTTFRKRFEALEAVEAVDSSSASSSTHFHLQTVPSNTPGDTP